MSDSSIEIKRKSSQNPLEFIRKMVGTVKGTETISAGYLVDIDKIDDLRLSITDQNGLTVNKKVADLISKFMHRDVPMLVKALESDLAPVVDGDYFSILLEVLDESNHDLRVEDERGIMQLNLFVFTSDALRRLCESPDNRANRLMFLPMLNKSDGRLRSLLGPIMKDTNTQGLSKAVENKLLH